MDRLYDLYLDVYEQAEEALQAPDDSVLRRICAEASSRNGSESLVALIALSDVEHRRPVRGRPEIVALVCQRVDLAR